MGGKCVLGAWRKLYINTSGARILQPSFGLVTAVTPQSPRMAEAGGDLWGAPVPAPAQAGPPGPQGCVTCPLETSRCALLQPRVELCPLPPALRILNSPPMATAALHLLLGSAEPLCWLPWRRNLSPIHPGSLLDCSCPAELPLQQGSGWFKWPPEICKLQPEAAPVCGGSDPLIFPLKHHLSLSPLHS